jgi:hypothetical protein
VHKCCLPQPIEFCLPQRAVADILERLASVGVSLHTAQDRSGVCLMPSKILVPLVTACLIGSVVSVWSQGGGGGGGGGSAGGAAGASSSSGTGASNGAVGTSPSSTVGTTGTNNTTPSGGTNDFGRTGSGATTGTTDQMDPQTHSKAPPGSRAAEQARRNLGAAGPITTPNGPSSGPGSPEQPLDGSRR